MKRTLCLSVLLLCTAGWALPDAAKTAPAAKLSDAVTAKRPIGGEYMGLYLMKQKVGYLYTNVKFAPGRDDQVIAINEFVFKATVGTKLATRTMKETRIYEAKPGGRLLTFTVEQSGDGGDQILEATNTTTAMRVLRKRPNLPNEVLNRKPSSEVVEDADQARVAIKRAAKVVGTITDGTDLDNYRVTTEYGGPSTKVIGGLQVKVFKVTTVSEKEKVPAEAFVDEQGRMVEISFGDNMKAVLESEEIAKRLDAVTVEVFGLTRITLPRPPSPIARAIPGEMKLTVIGLPDRFRKDTYRQKFKPVDKEKVQITITALPVKGDKKLQRPLVDPNGGTNLKSSLAVEADHADIVALAKKILGKEKDAYVSAKMISAWVGENLKKDYGSSSDRATDVLRAMKGDCTEHALLTTTLLRAAGIPARRVDGVVYMLNDDQVPALYWHEWVEAWVGEWTQLDPTFGQDLADATHFGLGEEGSAEITPLIGQLKVVDVL
jgi:transglutaminase-like putative cysteine protease